MPFQTQTNKILSTSNVEVNVVLKLTEEEARALDALAGYNDNAFLKFFYQNLGKHYLGPHEKGLLSLFDTIRRELPQHLRKADEARKIWKS